MKMTMTAYDFVNWFANSESRKNQFSRAALFALFDWYEQLEDDTGDELEFDPIAICCEWGEYEDVEDFITEYYGVGYLLEACEAMGMDEDLAMGEDADAIAQWIKEWLQDRTSVIEFDGGILVAAF